MTVKWENRVSKQKILPKHPIMILYLSFRTWTKIKVIIGCFWRLFCFETRFSQRPVNWWTGGPRWWMFHQIRVISPPFPWRSCLSPKSPLSQKVEFSGILQAGGPNNRNMGTARGKMIRFSEPPWSTYFPSWRVSGWCFFSLKGWNFQKKYPPVVI